MEHLIKNQLFGRSAVQVEIREKYELSGQYTPENVMAEYLDSFLAELDTRSVVERNMLQNAKCTFEEGNILCMQLIDTVIAQGKKDSLTDYLKGVYADRFGLPIEIRVMYKEPKESTLKYNDMRLQQEVDSILDQVEAVQKQKEEKEQEKEEKVWGKRNIWKRTRWKKIPETEKILAVLQKVDFQKAVDSRRVDFVIRRCL